MSRHRRRKGGISPADARAAADQLERLRPVLMSMDTAERVKDRVCGSRAAFGRATARDIATQNPDREVIAYRCPFCERFHTGKLMGMAETEQVAMAIRVLAQQ